MIDRHGEGLLLVLFVFYFALLFHIYLWYFIHANTVLTRTLNNNRCMHFLHITHISHSSYICICQTVAATATTTTATNHIVWEVRNRIHSKKNTISREFLTILNRNQFEGKFISLQPSANHVYALWTVSLRFGVCFFFSPIFIFVFDSCLEEEKVANYLAQYQSLLHLEAHTSLEHLVFAKNINQVITTYFSIHSQLHQQTKLKTIFIRIDTN